MDPYRAVFFSFLLSFACQNVVFRLKYSFLGKKVFVSASNVFILHVSTFNTLRYRFGTVSRRTESPVVLFQLLDGLFLHNVHVYIFHVKKKFSSNRGFKLKKWSKPTQTFYIRVKSTVEFISGTFNSIDALYHQYFDIFCLQPTYPEISILFDFREKFGYCRAVSSSRSGRKLLKQST